MNAQGAASGGDTTQSTQSEEHGAIALGEQKPHSEAIGDNSLLASVLDEMRVPAEQRPKPKEPHDEHDESQPAAEDAARGGDAEGSREGGARKQAPQAQQPQGQRQAQPQTGAQGSAAAPQDELTEQQRREWDPEALQRIHKITAQREAEREARIKAEQRAEQLALKQQSEAPAGEELAHVHTGEQLVAAERHYNELYEFGVRHPFGALAVKRPDGTVIPITKNAQGEPARELEDGEELVEDIGHEKAAELRLKGERVLKALPQRVHFLEQRQSFDAEIPAISPELANNEVIPILHDGQRVELPAQQIASFIARQMPGILEYPDGNQWIARAIRGLKLEMTEKAKGGKANGNGSSAVQRFLKQQPKIAPHVPAPRTRGPAPENRGEQIQQAKDRAAAAGGTVDSVEDLVGALLDAGSDQREEVTV